LINGVRQCYYPEPLRSPHSIPGIAFLEAGTYRDVLTISPQLGYVCPEVLNVPGRTAIRRHSGNVPKDVLGCCVVGVALGRDFLGNSRTAFEALMAELQEPEIIPNITDPTEIDANAPGTKSGVKSVMRELP
jgi:Family of unknown function (DUF5675)